MKLTPEQMDQKMDEHFGYEARDDVAGVVATLAHDATHDIVGYPTGPTHGRDAARAFYENMFCDLADSKVTTIRRQYGDDFMVDESQWTGTAVGRPFGLEGRGRPLSFRLLHVMNFTPEGEIAKEQVWFDFAAIIQQLPQ